MNKKYVALIVFFGILLLLPFSVQTIADFRGEKRFLSLDIFKDIFYTPFARESAIAAASDTLEARWQGAREAIAAGADEVDALENVVAALSDMERAMLTVNAYAELDSSEVTYKLLKQTDTLLASLADEHELFPQVDSCIKKLTGEFGGFSLVRAFLDVKHYGVWTSRYLRAFEHKVEDENALVLAVRPKYQLAVWNIFSDPGEKVVLGADSKQWLVSSKQESQKQDAGLRKQDAKNSSGDSLSSIVYRLSSSPWLFYRQDVEFLVQPSPLDVRSAKLDNPISAISKFREQLKAKGVELLVVIVPGKPSIYPERLTGKDASAPTFGHGKKILDSLTALGFNTVDLYTPLWNAKADDAKLGALYLNDDTHWTPRGAELAAREISAKVRELANSGAVNIGPETMNYVATDSVADRMGDIGEMSGLNKFSVFKSQRVVGHVVSQETVTERAAAPTASDSADSAIATADSSTAAVAPQQVIYDTTRTPFKDDFRKSKILILGDSFSRIYQTDAPVNAGWIAHFAREMKRPVSSIVSDGGASTLVREKLARKANVLKGKKLLIWEFVERDLRFGAEGWKDVKF